MLPPCEFRGLNSGQQARQQASLSAESSLVIELASPTLHFSLWLSENYPLSLLSIVRIQCYTSVWNCDCFKLGILAVIIISLIQNPPSSQLLLTFI